MAMINKEIPAWFTKGGIYQINLRNFCAEGTINAAAEELEFLAKLGFTTIYLCPIFEEDDNPDPKYISPRQMSSETGNPKNPYRMNDYFKIDSEYGSMDDLRRFTQKAHGLGLKVMLDLVYLHIGPNAPILSSFPNFAAHTEDGRVELTGWNFPKLNFEDKGLCEYLWCNMTYYIGEIGVDGFRCDTGDHVPLDFWVEGRRRMKAINPNSVLLNEGRKAEYLEKAFDASYDFDWHKDLFEVACGQLPVSALRECYDKTAAHFPKNAVLVRDIENHDIVTDWSPRIEIAAGHEGMEAIIALNYTVCGIPMTFCGNEIADSATLSMFANRFYMGKFEVTDRSIKDRDYSLRRQNIMRRLNELKKQSEILCGGELIWLENSCPDSIISFVRELDGKKIIFAANLTSAPAVAKIDGANLSLGNRLLESIEQIKIEGESINFPPYSYVLLEI